MVKGVNMTEQNQPQQPPQDLTIQDLAIMKQIIEISSERNSFKPGEMAAVGIVYNKLDTFLRVVEEQQKAAKEAAEKAAKDAAGGETND
jgi:hypothetical protein